MGDNVGTEGGVCESCGEALVSEGGVCTGK